MKDQDRKFDVCITIDQHSSYIKLYGEDDEIITNKESWFESMRREDILETLWFHYVQERHKD